MYSELFTGLYIVHRPSVQLLTFHISSSPEPQGQVQPNVEQSIPGWKEFEVYSNEGPRL